MINEFYFCGCFAKTLPLFGKINISKYEYNDKVRQILKLVALLIKL